MFYAEDLAYVHHVGFGGFARNAAPGLLATLREAGISEGTLVDLGCGSGIWLHEAAQAGYTTVGIDASPALIELARTVAPEATLHVGSLYDADLPPCDAVMALGEVLSYIQPGTSPPSLDIVFGRIAAALRPGGLLIFDVMIRDDPPMRYRSSTAGEDWAVLVDLSEDDAQERITRDIITFREVAGGYRRSEEQHVQRVVSREAVEDALGEAGFTAIRTTTQYGAHPLAPRRLAFIAQRRDALDVSTTL